MILGCELRGGKLRAEPKKHYTKDYEFIYTGSNRSSNSKKSMSDTGPLTVYKGLGEGEGGGSLTLKKVPRLRHLCIIMLYI